MKAALLRMTVSGLVCWLSVGIALAQTPVRKSKKKLPVVEQDASPPSELSATSPPGDGEDSAKAKAAPNATIQTGQIVEFGGELPRVKKLIESALALTTQGLTYTPNSDDPANGGMDCSGFISYLLRNNGFPDVPRDASGQYIWLRKVGAFRAVLSKNPDTFELEDLRPGDLLFWTGTYVTNHDPPLTHVMMYLGTEKDTGNRVMVGSSNGRSYHGKSRWGVSIFDFHTDDSLRAPGTKPVRSIFVGYGRPPGLRD